MVSMTSSGCSLVSLPASLDRPRCGSGRFCRVSDKIFDSKRDWVTSRLVQAYSSFDVTALRASCAPSVIPSALLYLWHWLIKRFQNLVPGMQHCLGTVVNAPWYFAGWSQAAALGTGYWSTPGFMDARHDALLALMAWTEQGQAPDEIIATTWKSTYDPTSGVLQQRPLCPWPQMAHWDGTGNVTEATSWNCQ